MNMSGIEDKRISIQNINTKKKVIIKLYKNNSELYNALSNLEVDAIITENYNYQKYIGNIGICEEVIIGRDFQYLNLNIDNNEIREAIRYAINPKDIIYNIYNEKYIETMYPLSYGSYLKAEVTNLYYDKEKAKNTLVKNGWEYDDKTWRHNSKEINVILSANKLQEEVAEILCENIKAIGIQITNELLTDYEYNQKLKTKSYDIILKSETMSILPLIEPYINTNDTNAKYELEQIKNISNEQILQEKYRILENIYLNQTENIGICFNSIIILHDEDLIGDFTGNWYNVFYNIDTWYKIKK